MREGYSSEAGSKWRPLCGRRGSEASVSLGGMRFVSPALFLIGFAHFVLMLNYHALPGESDLVEAALEGCDQESDG